MAVKKADEMAEKRGVLKAVTMVVKRVVCSADK